jgi:putative ABC transport system permease protein
VAGVDLEKFNQMSGGFKYLQGGPFQQPDDIIVDEYYARQSKVSAGNRLNLMNLDWRVCGVVEPGKLGRVFLPLGVLQDKTGNPGKLSQIYIKVDSQENVPNVIDALKAKLVDYPIYSMEELTSMISVSSVPLLEGFINVVVGVSVVISFSVVCLSMYMAVLQRTHEIGILKSLGASRSYILNIILREAGVFGIAGTLIGIAFSFGTRLVIQRMVPGSLTQSVVPGWWPIAGVIALSASLLGALDPGLRAALQDPIEALAYE